MNKIRPCLWFDNQAEEAVNFYTSIFKNSKIEKTSRYSESGPGGEKGAVMTIEFEIDGQSIIALNGGPHYKFTPAISLSVNCESQEEVDELWDKLTSDGGKEVQCGWLQDKYGLSWQIVPIALQQMLQDKDPEKAKRVMQAMLKMKKIDTRVLKQAYDNELN